MSEVNDKSLQIISPAEFPPPPQIASSENYLKWRRVVGKKGVLELFDYFIWQADQRSGVTIEPWKNKSITLNIAGKPVVKIFPRQCNPKEGL